MIRKKPKVNSYKAERLLNYTISHGMKGFWAARNYRKAIKIADERVLEMLERTIKKEKDLNEKTKQKLIELVKIRRNELENKTRRVNLRDLMNAMRTGKMPDADYYARVAKARGLSLAQVKDIKAMIKKNQITKKELEKIIKNEKSERIKKALQKAAEKWL